MDGSTLPRKRKIREEKRPACEACRSMKLRCDAFLDCSRPCSRCRKRGVDCTVLPERRKGNASSDAAIHTPEEPLQHRLSHRNKTSPRTHNSTSNYSGSATQTISGVEVSADLINICFNLFNSYYSPLLPILSSTPTPDQTFQESELKFWVIVAIGSRRCTQDPTLLSSIAGHVEDLAVTSLRLRGSPYPIIEALLFICTWPLSTDRTFFSSTYMTISNTIVSLTLQAGLHRCWSLHPIFRDRDLDADQDGTRGTKLWACSVIIAQIAMLSSGLPSMYLSESQHLSKVSNCCIGLPPWLLHRGQINGVMVRAQQALSELGLVDVTASAGRGIGTLVSVLEFELSNVLPCDDLLGELHTSLAMLHIRAMHLFSVEEKPDMLNLAKLLNSAIQMMEIVSGLDETMKISQHCPDYVFEAIVLASAVLLKLVKGVPEDGLDRDAGKSAFFTSINLLKSISITNNDVSARVAAIFTELWSNNDIYKNSTGMFVRPLKVRNRLIISVAFDCFWWYREAVAGWGTRLTGRILPVVPVSSSLDEMPQFGDLTEDLFNFWDFDWATITPGVVLNDSSTDPPSL